MARNERYYKRGYNYALRKGLDHTDAEGAATTLSVLIPLRHDFGNEIPTLPDNDYVVASIEKLHGGKQCHRVWPFDLTFPLIRVASFKDLPVVTTYGQTYYVRDVEMYLETKMNGVTSKVKPLILMEIGEPLKTDPVQLAALKIVAEEHGLTIVETNKPINDPSNIAGLAMLGEHFRETEAAAAVTEASLAREEARTGWSRPTNKLKNRSRPASQFLRMQRRRRRG